VLIQSHRLTSNQSLPALRFHASHSKAKYWHAWRAAMPQALMNSKARDLDKKSILGMSFGVISAIILLTYCHLSQSH
jgi:hypothetical protein